MILNKRLFIRFFLLAEVIVALYWYCSGSHGLYAMRAVLEQHRLLEIQIEHAQSEVDELKNKIDAWQQSDFYKEKIAREQLQMARPEEQVFVLE